MAMKRFLTSVMALLTCIVLTAQNDVDTRIPVNEQSNTNTFVVIIANENYKYEHVVPFALNDGETFKLYCEKTLGIPKKNIRYAADATLNDMRMQLQWLQKVMKAYGGEAQAIVYYSGHGMPDDNTRQAYLLPVDGNSTMPGSGMSTATLYKELGAMPSVGTLVLLDACFSGARRDGQMLAAQSKGVAIKPKEDVVSGNLVVFSASQGGETAYPYQEKKHGLFTYCILEQLQENGGYMPLGDLSDEVSRQVGRTSIVENDKSQTPTITASSTITDWRKWILAHKRAAKYENVRRTTPITQMAQDTPLMPQPVISKEKLPGMVITVGYVQFSMIPVKGGMFTMGATAEQGSDAENDEKPTHKVVISDYYIGETEVTQELWETVMGYNPSQFKGGTLPVESVGWEDCQKFIKKLNEMTGKNFRLPTEAEWEFAARGGNLSKGYKYSGSNNVSDVAWYDGNSSRQTHDVKGKAPNELGIYDMSGNVYELCSDWYQDSYSTILQTNPQGPSSGYCRVYRGGCWYYEAFNCRVSNRYYAYPRLARAVVADNVLGLRLAL